MRVRAIKQGFFGGKRIRVGDEFECPNTAFSKKWMEKVNKPANKAEKKEEPKKPATDALHAETLSEIATLNKSEGE